MSSYISWIDYSPADRDRMNRVIALFQESETRDELGVGTIRDAFSDALFPGTSTIQTRLRYFLFVPWIYLDLERRRVPSAKIAQRARAFEVSLIDPLKNSDEPDGTLGVRAGKGLKRLPSSVYWAGLDSWNIRLYAGSLDQYHGELDRFYFRREHCLRPDDAGVGPERHATWHERIPAPPEGWPSQVSFKLRRQEALYLRGRILSSHPDSMLAYLALNSDRTDVQYPWVHPDLAGMSEQLINRLDLARRFSLVMRGSVLLYNLMLAELSSRRDADELVQGYQEDLASWAACDESEDLVGWSSKELWDFVAEVQGRVPTKTRQFVKRWMTVVETASPGKIPNNEDARSLVKDRERSLKLGRSRFTNSRARDQWSGASGTARMNYRWSVTQRMLNDLHDGLGR